MPDEANPVTTSLRRTLVEGVPILERDLPDGRTLTLQPLFWGYAQLGISTLLPDGTPITSVYADSWQYQDLGVALVALLTWDGRGEPAGWYKHAASGRRRPDGDPAQEYTKDE